MFPGGTVVKNPPANTGDARDMGLRPESGRYPGVGKLPGNFRGWRSLAGCNPWGHKELNMTEQWNTPSHETLWVC